MTPEQLAASLIKDVKRHNLGLQTKVMWMQEGLS